MTCESYCAVLIGLAGAGPLFTAEVLEAMNAGCPHQAPIVMAMSNPTAKMECTAEEAQRYTGGRAVYASGSPQEDVMWEGKRIASTQANNMCARLPCAAMQPRCAGCVQGRVPRVRVACCYSCDRGVLMRHQDAPAHECNPGGQLAGAEALSCRQRSTTSRPRQPAEKLA